MSDHSSPSYHSKTDDNDNKKSKPRRSVPVPWIFTLAYLIGVGLELFVPMKIVFSPFLGELLVSLGIALIFLGALLMIWPQYIFRKYHTTTVPTETATTFVNWGPYRFSRNPMYLGLFLFFAGLSLSFALLWSIVCLVVVVVYVNSKIIPIEEKQLAKNFGKAYEDYCRKVKRWI